MATNSALVVLANLMKTGANSDLVFECNGHEFKVHRLVVLDQSPVVKAALSPYWKEGQGNTIDMNAFDPQTVGRLVQYLYTGDYSESDDDYRNIDIGKGMMPLLCVAFCVANQLMPKIQASPATDSKSPPPVRVPTPKALSTHIKVNAIGDYYAITKLMSLANSKITDLFPKVRKGVVFCNVEPPAWVMGLPSAAKLAIESTGDMQLLEIIAAETAANISALTVSDDLKNMEDMSDFAFKVIKNCAVEIQRHVRLNIALGNQCARHVQKIAELEKKITEGEAREKLNNKTIEGLNERLLTGQSLFGPQKKRKTTGSGYY
ncbi:hypothetical protein CP533_5024 [Ophiocordyceps camponoti-saundersi (nom. inval.)]|nr:hypothetical protein CP533_5024 [Ophiocordyceps camponoti-saundersi (nom. inval.)]